MRYDTLSTDVLVIGSGPGGTTTALHAAEAGRQVLLLEEGPDLSLQAAPSYSLAEMTLKWRNAGLTPTFGRTRLTYIEGRCVGGASEVNAALYHRPLPSVLEAWRSLYGVEGIGGGEDLGGLAPHVEAVEAAFSVSRWPSGDVGRASAHLKAAADTLGWKCNELPRFWRYERAADGGWTGHRQSVREVLTPRAVAAGVELRAGVRVERLEIVGGHAVAAWATQQGPDGVRRWKIVPKAVVICAGAVQTPLILRRSGHTRRIGDTLTMNPMIRVAAVFDSEVNDPRYGVPVHQVEEFKPRMTLGCSYASPAHLALWLAGMPNRDAQLAEWRRMSIYYVKIGGSSRGRVRSFPWLGDAVVQYSASDDDRRELGRGLKRLGQLLFAGGATRIFDPLRPGEVLTHPKDLDRFDAGVPKGSGALSAIHLHSTVPMGAMERGGAADAFGKVYGLKNVYVNDASLLPDTPSINPQGLILALARRNALRVFGGV